MWHWQNWLNVTHTSLEWFCNTFKTDWENHVFVKLLNLWEIRGPDETVTVQSISDINPWDVHNSESEDFETFSEWKNQWYLPLRTFSDMFRWNLCSQKTGHPESLLFGSLTLVAMTMTLLKLEVHIMMISIAKFHKIRIRFTYRIFTSKMCAITYGFKCMCRTPSPSKIHQFCKFGWNIPSASRSK